MAGEWSSSSLNTGPAARSPGRYRYWVLQLLLKHDGKSWMKYSRTCPTRSLLMRYSRTCPQWSLLMRYSRTCPQRSLLKKYSRTCPQRSLLMRYSRPCPQRSLLIRYSRTCFGRPPLFYSQKLVNGSHQCLLYSSFLYSFMRSPPFSGQNVSKKAGGLTQEVLQYYITTKGLFEL